MYLIYFIFKLNKLYQFVIALLGIINGWIETRAVLFMFLQEYNNLHIEIKL